MQNPTQRFFHASFTTGQLLEAADVGANAFQAWMRRKLLVGHRDGAEITGGGAKGVHRRYTYFNVIEVAVAKHIIDLGVDAALAFSAAADFAHLSSGMSSYYGAERIPGIVYDYRDYSGFTYLATTGQRHCIGLWKRSGFTAPGAERDRELERICAELQSRSFIFVEVNPIFERVVGRLGYDPRDVLALAYDEAPK